jgi:Ribonuclease G/E
MARAHIYIDDGVGETRGVLTLGGQPERLFIYRIGQDYPLLGSRYRARVIKVERGAGLALLDLGAHRAALRIKPDRPAPIEGQSLDVEIAIEPQPGKDAVVRVIGEATGNPVLLGEAVSLRQRLAAFAPEAEVTIGAAARAMADLAEDQVLAIEFTLPGGASMAVEPTRALTAVDIDLGSGGGRDPKRVARDANMNAIVQLARLMRLKAMGGLVVIDLVGRGHDGTALSRAVQQAFGPDQPGVVIGPITKFGTLELALPRRFRPLADILCDVDGRPFDRTLALRLCRAIEREAKADPGGRLLARCSPRVAAAIQAYTPALVATLGARFEIASDHTLAREDFQVSVK